MSNEILVAFCGYCCKRYNYIYWNQFIYWETLGPAIKRKICVWLYWGSSNEWNKATYIMRNFDLKRLVKQTQSSHPTPVMQMF